MIRWFLVGGSHFFMYFLLIIFVYLWAHTPGRLRLCILWCLSPGHQLEKEGWEQIVAGSPRCSGSTPQQMLGVATPCFSWGFDGAPDELWNEGLQVDEEELNHHAFFSVASLRPAYLFGLVFFWCFCWLCWFQSQIIALIAQLFPLELWRDPPNLQFSRKRWQSWRNGWRLCRRSWRRGPLGFTQDSSAPYQPPVYQWGPNLNSNLSLFWGYPQLYKHSQGLLIKGWHYQWLMIHLDVFFSFFFPLHAPLYSGKERRV